MCNSDEGESHKGSGVYRTKLLVVLIQNSEKISWLEVNKRQLVNCIRWTDVCFLIHEDFIGMLPLEKTNADQVVAIKNALLRSSAPVGSVMMEKRRRQARKLE